MGYMREVQAYPFSTHLHPSVWSDTCNGNGNGNGMMLLMDGNDIISFVISILLCCCKGGIYQYISISVY